HHPVQAGDRDRPGLRARVREIAVHPEVVDAVLDRFLRHVVRGTDIRRDDLGTPGVRPQTVAVLAAVEVQLAGPRGWLRVRQEPGEPRPPLARYGRRLASGAGGRLDAPTPAPDARHDPRWEPLVSAVEVVQGEADLFEVVLALDAGGGLADLL